MSFIRPQLRSISSRSTFMEDLRRGQSDFSATEFLDEVPPSQAPQPEPVRQSGVRRQQPSRRRKKATTGGEDDGDPDGDTVIADLNKLPALLTVEETAEILRTTTNAIYTMASRAKLPGAVHVGRRLLVRRRELLEFLNEGRVPPPKRSR